MPKERDDHRSARFTGEPDAPATKGRQIEGRSSIARPECLGHNSLLGSKSRLIGRAASPPVREATSRLVPRSRRGAVYTALDRLERKDYVTHVLGEATPERGGRPKKYPVPEYNAARSGIARTFALLSQAVLTSVLNTSLSTVRKWEVGDKKPSGPSSKLLNLIERKGLEAGSLKSGGGC